MSISSSGDEQYGATATHLKKNLVLPSLRAQNPQQLNNSVDDNMKIDDENIGLMEENKNECKSRGTRNDWMINVTGM